MPQLGVREVKSIAMQGAVQKYLEGLVAERLPKRPRRGSMERAMKSVVSDLRPKRTDSADDKRYKEIVARSLAGFGSAIAPEVLSQNDGSDRLQRIQKLVTDAIPEFLR